MFKKAIKSAKSHIQRGNMFMLAIGLLLGTVFGAVVSSLANDIIMSYISTNLLKYNNLDDYVVSGMKVGKFLGVLLNFIIVTVFIFVVLVIYYLIYNFRKAKLEKAKATEAPAPKVPTTEELILAELKELNQNLKK